MKVKGEGKKDLIKLRFDRGGKSRGSSAGEKEAMLFFPKREGGKKKRKNLPTNRTGRERKRKEGSS